MTETISVRRAPGGISARSGRRLALFAALVIGAGAFGWIAVNRLLLGLPQFMLWKASSGAFEGGRYVHINGVKLYYEVYGHGRPVLLLHGGTGFLEMGHYQISALASRWRVIAPDSRGQGRSEDGPGPLHYQTMTDDMISLLDRLRLGRVDVVGDSDGGIIGLDMAMRYPARVKRLVTIGANFDPSGLRPSRRPESADAESLGMIFVRTFYRLLAPNPAHWSVFYGKIVRMWGAEPHYTPAELGRIKAPSLIMAGQHDLILRAHTDALARAIPRAREIIIPDAGHLAAVTRPGAVDRAIVAFLAPDEG